MTESQTTVVSEYLRFEMASRAVCRAEGPSFPANKKGEAAQQDYVERNWRAWLQDIADGYARWEARQ